MRLEEILKDKEKTDKYRDYVVGNVQNTPPTRFYLFTEQELSTLIQKERETNYKHELIEALYALISMWNQYCGKDGHSFMNAGEEASAVLMKYGILKDDHSEAEYDSAEKYLSQTKGGNESDVKSLVFKDMKVSRKCPKNFVEVDGWFIHKSLIDKYLQTKGGKE
jgi:hypothetical protein